MVNSKQIMNKCSCVITIALFFSISAASGQDISVRAMLDTARAMIGDQMRLHIRLEKPDATTVIFPALQDTLTKKIEIISKSSIDTSRSDTGRTILSQDLLITVFDTGFFEIPPLSFAFQTEQFRDTIRTTPVYFEIVSLPVDTAIRDIRANLKAPINAAEILPFALGFIALLMIALVLVYWIRKRRQKGTLVPDEIPAEPANVIALRELAQLREDKPWAHKQVKHYYIRLTEILRRYIERRYRIMALEQTTDEILESLKTSTNGAYLKRLAGILKLADLVKFAKVIPDPEENASQLEEAVAFVNSTSLPKHESEREGSFDPEPVQSNVEL
jgi:hypothetical protein